MAKLAKGTVLTDLCSQGKDPRHDDGPHHVREDLQLAHSAGWSRLVLKIP
jgi:hypothetical protein